MLDFDTRPEVKFSFHLQADEETGVVKAVLYDTAYV